MDDDRPAINPTTGLPMLGDTIDVGGNLYNAPPETVFQDEDQSVEQGSHTAFTYAVYWIALIGAVAFLLWRLL